MSLSILPNYKNMKNVPSDHSAPKTISSLYFNVLEV